MPASRSVRRRLRVSPGPSPPGVLAREPATGIHPVAVGQRRLHSVALSPVALSPAKSNKVRSASVPGATFFSAEKMASVRPRLLALPLAQHLLHRCALQVFLRAAQIARDQREAARGRVARDVALGDIAERADDDVPAIVAHELRRHRLEATAVEHVEEQRLDDVVAVMPERDPGDAVLRGVVVQRAASQARAQAAHGAAFRDEPLHHAVGVLLDDVVLHAQRLEVLRQDVRREARLLLVEIHGEQRELHRRAPLQREQHVEQRVRILAAREADHDAVALPDHAVVLDGLAHETAQLRGQLALRIRQRRRRCDHVLGNACVQVRHR